MLREIPALAKEAFGRWKKHDCPQWGAALSFYTALSLAPLLVVALFVAGLFYDHAVVERRMDQQVHDMVGPQGAEAVKLVLRNAAQPGEGGAAATLISLVVLVLGASAVFGQLQKALNHVWGVKTNPAASFGELVVSRLISMGIVVALGFLLLVSLVLSAVASSIAESFGAGMVAHILNLVISMGLITVLMALVFRVLPDAEIRWRDVWVGAAATAVLISIGKSLIGLYLGHATLGSAYGAAGSVIVLLVWVYYSAQMMLFGAEFTAVWAERYGAAVVPDEHGVWADAALRRPAHGHPQPVPTARHASASPPSRRAPRIR